MVNTDAFVSPETITDTQPDPIATRHIYQLNFKPQKYIVALMPLWLSQYSWFAVDVMTGPCEKIG